MAENMLTIRQFMGLTFFDPLFLFLNSFKGMVKFYLFVLTLSISDLLILMCGLSPFSTTFNYLQPLSFLFLIELSIAL